MKIEFGKKLLFTLPPLIITSIGVFWYMGTQYSSFKVMDKSKDFKFTIKKLKAYQNHIFINDSLKIDACYDWAIPTSNHLIDYINLGDSITKRANSDTITAFKMGMPPKQFIIRDYE